MSTDRAITLVNAALDDETGEIVLRGVIHPESLARLRVPEYQREVLREKVIRAMTESIVNGNAVPDIELGMRGGNFQETGNHEFQLLDEVYIVDGLQRRTAALAAFSAGGSPRLGATVRFNTSEQLERARFEALNTLQTRLSPNVILRGKRHSSPAVEMIYALCQDSSFALYGKVSWGQYLNRNQLLSARILLASAGGLHSFLAPGLLGSRYDEVAATLSSLIDKGMRNVIRKNIFEFWNVVNECWNLAAIHYADKATALRSNFLVTLSRVFSDHEDFWRDAHLYVDTDLRRKLATFPLSDPHISALAAGGQASARSLMYELVIKHINSGRRAHRLTARKPAVRPGAKPIAKMVKERSLTHGD